MKKYFLSYNPLTKHYYLDYGCFDRSRQDLGKMRGEDLLEKLKEILPLHRQIMIYSQKDMDKSIQDILEEGFKNTRINMEFIKNLSRLC